MPPPAMRPGEADTASVARIIVALRGRHSMREQDKRTGSLVDDTKGLFRAIEQTPAFIKALDPKDRAFLKAFAPAIGHRTSV
ncbi:MAG: hypothetical protein SFZ24_06390 [Planctomycetota bacterium]|nr:hypothetical protein [Planctomycetota bacterium]